MTEILLTETLSLNSKINKTGLFALIFYYRTINIFGNYFIKNPNPFIMNQLSIIGTGKEPITKICY